MLFAKRRTSRFSHDTSSVGNSCPAPAPLIASTEPDPLILAGLDHLLRKARLDFRKQSSGGPPEASALKAKTTFHTLCNSTVTRGRRDVEERNSFNWGSGASFLSADHPPQPRLKASHHCQAKGPELVINETNTRSNIFA